MRTMKRVLLFGLSLLAIAQPGCHRHDRAAPTVDVKKSASDAPAVTVTDEELTKFLVWMRADYDMGDRHELERTTVTQDAEQRANTGDDVANDPQGVAMHPRQKDEFEADKAAMPVDREKARMLIDGIECVGLWATRGDLDGSPRKFTPERDLKKIAAVRAKYGDAYVDWILARQSKIVAELTK